MEGDDALSRRARPFVEEGQPVDLNLPTKTLVSRNLTTRGD